MGIKELLQSAWHAFFRNIGAILTAAYVSCLLYRPDAVFKLDFLGQILLLAAVTSLARLVFLSRRELRKMEMLVRRIIHILIITGAVIGFAFGFGWVQRYNYVQIAFLAVCVCIVITLLRVSTYLSQRREAQNLQSGIERFQKEKEKKK